MGRGFGMLTDSKNKEKYNPDIIICVGVVVFLMTMLLSAMLSPSKLEINDNAIDYSDSWTGETGSLIDLNDLRGRDHFTVHRRVEGEDVATRALCFKSKDIRFTMQLDGETVYEFRPEFSRILGKSYGYYVHVIELPNIETAANVSIEIDNIYKKGFPCIKDFELMDSEAYMLNMMRRQLPTSLIYAVIFIAAFVVMFFGLLGKKLGIYRNEIVSAGAYLMICVLSVICNFDLFKLSAGNPMAFNFVQHYALMIMPYPLITYVTYAIKQNGSKVPLSVGVACAINVLICAVSTFIGKYDYMELNVINQAVLVATHIIILYYIVYVSATRRLRHAADIIPVAGFLFYIVCSAVAAINYKNGLTYTPTEEAYTVGFSIFAATVIGHEISTIARISNKGIYAEVMEELAYQDNLTNLSNRQAYDRDTKKLEETTEDKDYTLIMLDMNYLKQINDGIGHAEGDRYLKTLGIIIENTFAEPYARCYRIGGDEFFIIEEGLPEEEANKARIREFLDRVDRFNNENSAFKPGRTPLSVAYGYKAYNPAKDNINAAIKEADDNMYECKTIMKQKSC